MLNGLRRMNRGILRSRSDLRNGLNRSSRLDLLRLRGDRSDRRDRLKRGNSRLRRFCVMNFRLHIRRMGRLNRGISDVLSVFLRFLSLFLGFFFSAVSGGLDINILIGKASHEIELFNGDSLQRGVSEFIT